MNYLVTGTESEEGKKKFLEFMDRKFKRSDYSQEEREEGDIKTDDKIIYTNRIFPNKRVIIQGIKDKHNLFLRVETYENSKKTELDLDGFYKGPLNLAYMNKEHEEARVKSFINNCPRFKLEEIK